MVKAAYIIKYNVSGSNGLGTLLTVTGTGFSSENASIMVGKARCHVEATTGE